MNAKKIEFFIGLVTKSGRSLPLEFVVSSAKHHLGLAGFDSFSVVEQIGYWGGESERSVVITLIESGASNGFPSFVPGVAKALAFDCDQEAILWACAPVWAGLEEGGE